MSDEPTLSEKLDLLIADPEKYGREARARARAAAQRDVARAIRRKQECPVPECGSESLRKGLRCQRPVGHADAHMHFGTNGTTAWGFGI